MTLKRLFFLQKLNIHKYFSSSAFSIEPVKKYVNADQDKVSIFADNRNKTGVYR
jgi:hypothetical protein